MALNRPYDIRLSIVWLVRLQSVLSHRLGPLWLYHGAAKGARWGLWGLKQPAQRLRAAL